MMTKDAWILIIPRGVCQFDYPGVMADLYFSSPENFKDLWGRNPDVGQVLVKVTVPLDFDDWDFIPEDY